MSIVSLIVNAVGSLLTLSVRVDPARGGCRIIIICLGYAALWG